MGRDRAIRPKPDEIPGSKYPFCNTNLVLPNADNLNYLLGLVVLFGLMVLGPSGFGLRTQLDWECFTASN